MADDRLKILWVKAGGLVPLDSGGRIRSYNILRHLAERHAVTFFSFHAASANDAHAGLEQQFERVVSVPLELPEPRSFSELRLWAASLLARQPYNLFKYCRPQVLSKLSHVLSEETYDVTICDFLIAAGAIPWDLPIPKILFTHNVESLIWKRHFEVTHNPLWKAVAWREFKDMERAEEHYLRRADRVLAVSEDDARFFRRWIESSKISVIPTGVDVEYFQPAAETEQPNSIVFVGSMDWLPNEDAVVYFINEIFPMIRKQIPDVSFCVAGRNPSRSLQRLAVSANLKLTGWVEDIRPFLAQAAVCVVPLRIGSGTRLKIFEAMAMGKAVVSTSIGAEGLPVRNAEHLLIADDPQNFADSVIRLLRDTTLRKELGSRARQLVTNNYSWHRVSRIFEDALRATLSNAHEAVR